MYDVEMDYFGTYFNYNQVIEKAHSLVFLLVNMVTSDNSTTSVPARLDTVKSTPRIIFFNLLSPVTFSTATILYKSGMIRNAIINGKYVIKIMHLQGIRELHVLKTEA